MKKVFILLSMIFIFLLPGCGKQAAPIVLPDPENITEIRIKDGESIRTLSDSEQIGQIISGLADAKPTNKQSIQDAPLNKNAIQIEFQFKADAPFKAGTSTVFVYEERGKYYVEQPYHGIYSISQDLYNTF